MEFRGKEIKDACAECGEVLECKLFLEGHGIGTERNNVTEMLKCQFDHKRTAKRE